MDISIPRRRLPADWEPHAWTIVAWPGRPSVWEKHIDAGRAETLEMVLTIAQTENVILSRLSTPTRCFPPRRTNLDPRDSFG